MSLDRYRAKAPSNEWTVSDLAGALKRTLEDAFGHVRLRGEVSGYRGAHSSGHAYFALKDEGARIDAVMWSSAFLRLRLKPEEGMEVIATGRITTFPGKSAYQIVVETLEPAGIGALMALLEERRQRLAAEGLFAPERKRRLPFLPQVIGIVTSPTGAVIRDILHRLDDRFARRVLVWPVRVQGEGSGGEIAAAIRGFNRLEPAGRVPRPDVIIVARGGGSIEDLWGFNDEAVVRAAAASAIPLVSAVGHETDWTLLDHAADLRAPTPTGAAEMVVPVRAELVAAVAGLARRHGEAALRGLDRRRADLRAATRGMPATDALFAGKRQRLDVIDARLARFSPAARVAGLRGRLAAVGERPREALERFLEAWGDKLKQSSERLIPALRSQLARKRIRLDNAGQLFDSLSYKSVLRRGYALVFDATGRAVKLAAGVKDGHPLTLEFADGKAAATGGRAYARRLAGRKSDPAKQPSLFDEI